MNDSTITEVTRRTIARSAGSIWWGDLSEVDFLSRLYNLDELPSHDTRYRTARRDIVQHRVSFPDWDSDWVYYDERFNLMRAPDSELLNFLCETVHPLVRFDAKSVEWLVDAYNAFLKVDGWEMYVASEISGRPVYEARRIGSKVDVFPEATGWDKVDRQIEGAKKVLERGENEEDFQNVGLSCREALISLAQAVYEAERHGSSESVPPSNTDAKGMLGAYFSVELAAGSNEETRSFAKAALKLALALQHKRTADFRMAALCIEATAGVINIAAILSGRRG